MNTTALCEASCAARGRHAPECVADECDGCQRRQAADGLRLCEVHVERLREDAESASALYDDLGLVLIRRGGASERTSGSAVSAPAPDDATMEARYAIRSTLVRLARHIVTQRGVSAPSMVYRGRHYVDTSVATLGAFVGRHSAWLAAQPDAGRYANELHDATHGAVRAIAYPTGRDRLYVGECPVIIVDRDGSESACGTKLYQSADQPLITCVGCGTQDTIEQWQRWLVGETGAVGDAYAIAAHLSVLWMRPVDPVVIRMWQYRGHVTPLQRADPTLSDPQRVVTLRDDRGRTQYRINDVVECAARMWGKPYATRRTQVSDLTG